MSVVEEAVVGEVKEDLPGDAANVVGVNQVKGERAGVYLTALIALAVPSLIVLAFFLPSRGSTTIATSNQPRADTPAVGLDSTEVVRAPATTEPVVASVTDVATSESQASTGEDIESSQVVESVESPEPAPTASIDLASIDPATIEVFVYDETPSANGEYSFALRLKSNSTPGLINTSVFAVTVENTDGVAAPSVTRFVHESLPVDSSALAAVRVADTGDSEYYVVITLADTEIARLPIIFG